MDRIAELSAIIERYDLNSHPFYTDWRAGTLPVEKLRTYASEYGDFVGTIDQGWETLCMGHYADEEREHELMWGDFQAELGAKSNGDKAETAILVTAAEKLFADRATAVGALYSFEAQQPNTSRTKLEGLNEHYSFSDQGKEYFRVHADDFNEVEDLKKVVAAMTDEEFARTKTACGIVCAAMWGALDGVYYTN